jgi:glycosyltransferase involved in cell wall biosynthesis
MNSGRVTISYAGVHQAFQLALAAQEMGELKDFYCTLYDAPKKWGALFGGYVGEGSFNGRRVEGLDLDKITEFPWPLVWKATRDRFYGRGKDKWLSVNNSFDWWVSRKIEKSPPKIFVGTATSDLRCLEVAKRNGSTLVHDCPGLHPLVQAQIMGEAADRAGIKLRTGIRERVRNARTSLRGMTARKLLEYSLADILLVYSDFHRKSFEDAGIAKGRLFLAPLWVDTGQWYREIPRSSERTQKAPLKLLFVGSIELRKGIPFLLRAVAACGNAVQLTVVGPGGSQTESRLSLEQKNVKYLSPQPSSKLRKIYESHDVFVLPSVADPFPRVVLEAMACGLPVIETQNCGTPVPNSSWKVPAMDSESLAKRIMHYVDDRNLVVDHGNEAAAFAAQFGPEKYRQNIQGLFKELLRVRN